MTTRGGHRPRQHVRRDRLLQEGQGRRASSPSSGSRPTSPGPRAAATAPSEIGQPPHPPRQERRGLRATSATSSSKAYIEGFYYHPRIDKQLLKEHSQGPHRPHRLPRRRGPAACCRGRHGRAPGAPRASTRTSSSPGTSSSRCSPTACPSRRRSTTTCKQLSRDVGIPLVATADAHYVKREDAKAHELLMCIASGKTLADSKRHAARDRRALHQEPRGDARALRRRARGGRTTRMRIAEHVQRRARARQADAARPSRCPTATTPDSYLAELARDGLDRRFERDAATRSTATPTAQRLEMELAVIQQDGVRRLLPHRPGLHQLGEGARHPRRAGPRLGRRLASSPTRCASPTSIRIPYNLLFERFLNPERVSMPDFDVDFCQDRRDEVIELRHREVRQGQRRADHHLRLAQGEERASTTCAA